MGGLRWARTVAPLPWTQRAALVKHRLLGPARIPKLTRGRAALDPSVVPPGWGPSADGILGANGMPRLLERLPYDPRTRGWTPVEADLFLYTLHYHGWLPLLTARSALDTMLDWSWSHPRGVGWEPYPCSIRLLHWTAAFGRADREGLALPRALEESFSTQWEHLRTHEETHLDGNHVWTNRCALACGAFVLDLSSETLGRVMVRLLDVVGRQLDPDGFHRERTPTYHCLLTEQLLLVADLARTRAPRFADHLRAHAQRMGRALATVVHPDRDVALWNDSQLDHPSRPEILARRYGIRWSEGDAHAFGSGFARRAWGRWTVLANRGDLGLPNQVGHIHADGGSIEVSLDQTRVLVDAGVGTYETGAARSYARSTAAHNTVTLGRAGADRHELWASHRIGGRGHVGASEWASTHMVLRGSDWQRSGTHRRLVRYVSPGVVVVDAVEPRQPFVVHYHVPSSYTPRVDDSVCRLLPSKASEPPFRMHVRGGTWRWARVPGWSGLSRPCPRQCLSIQSAGDPVEVSLLPEPTQG